MSKINNKKKASLVFKTLGVSSVVATTLFLSAGIIQTPNIIEIKSENNRSLNEVQTQALENSRIYFSNFEFMNATDETNFLAPYNREAIKQWETIKKNLESNEIVAFKNTASYKYIMNKVVELLAQKDNLEVKEAMIKAPDGERLWNTMKDNIGWKDFSNIVGSVEELQKKLKTLSGFISGNSDTHRIATLSNKSKKVWANLSETNIETPIEELTGDYKTVVKIAEFEPDVFEGTSGTISLNFNFSSKNNTTASRGSLIIRNLSGKTLKQGVDDLDVFGRWDLGSGQVIGGAGEININIPEIMPNFVLSQESKKISIFARLKAEETLQSISVDRNFGYTSISNFGILDSQLSNSTPLFDETNKEKVVSNIQFFSTKLQSTTATTAEAGSSINKGINKKFEYYLGSNTNLNLNLFYKTKNEYKELFSFVDDEVSTTNQQMLKFGIDDKGEAFSIDTSKIEFSKSVLSEVVSSVETDINNAAVSSQTFKNISTALDPVPSFFKQQIFFNDLVMAFSIKGSPINVGTGIMGIKIEDLSQKIFFEKPINYDSSPDSVLSQAKASKWVNEESEVIAKLSEVYSSWANSGSNGGSSKLGLTNYNKIKSSKNGNKFTKIHWGSESVDYTGTELYNSLVDEYSTYTAILTELISGYTSQGNIFQVPTTPASIIIENQLLAVENGDFRNKIIENVKKIITDKPVDEIKQIENQLALLVNVKFSEMKKSIFDAAINKFYYDEIKKYLDSEITGKIFNNSSEFLSFDSKNELFNITNDKKILSIENKFKGSDIMASLFKVLYSGDESKKLFFGSSIFSAVSTSGGVESLLNLFISFSTTDQISTFNSNTTQTIANSLNVYDRLLSTFGFGINDITERSLVSGNQIALKWGNKDFAAAVSDMTEQFVKEKTVNILQKEYKYIFFKSLVTSSNIYNSLKYRYENSPFVEEVDKIKDKEKITNILNAGIILPETIFTWSRIQKSATIIDYIESFSKNLEESKKLSNEIKTDPLILDLVIKEQQSLFDVNPFLDMVIIWPILIGLIAVGILVVSSISLAGTIKTSKLSSKKVVATILIIAVIISIVLLGASIFGFISL